MSGAFVGEGKSDARDADTIAGTARLRAILAPFSVPDRAVVICGCLPRVAMT